MITAKEFLKQNPRSSVEGFMIEFAKLHVKKALKHNREHMPKSRIDDYLKENIK